MKYSNEEIANAVGIIKPTLPDYDDNDHELAKLRFILYTISEELIDVLYESRPTADSASALNKLHIRLDAMIGTDDSMVPDGSEQNDIDSYAQAHNWEYWREIHLTDHHYGDCTGSPCGCAKCHAEQFYQFPSTYVSKQVGANALSIYLETVGMNDT